MPDMTMNESDMELVCLEILARGEDLMAIGVWEPIVRRLRMKEFAVKVGNGYRITDAGRAFFAKSEGVEFEQVLALAPPMPNWIVQPLDGFLVVLRKNDLAVSGYEALCARFSPIIHNQQNGVETAFIVGEYDEFLQVMLDAAWARGLRPTDGAS